MSERQPTNFRVKWSIVGLGGLLVGIASLGVLAVVATVKEVDTLSTVALVLAILAFVIQIITFIAQTAQASQQAVDVQAVNSETKALLVEVRTNTSQTLETVRGQVAKMIDSAFGNIRDAVDDAVETTTTEGESPLTRSELAELGDQIKRSIEQSADEARRGLININGRVPIPDTKLTWEELEGVGRNRELAQLQSYQDRLLSIAGRDGIGDEARDVIRHFYGTSTNPVRDVRLTKAGEEILAEGLDELLQKGWLEKVGEQEYRPGAPLSSAILVAQGGPKRSR